MPGLLPWGDVMCHPQRGSKLVVVSIMYDYTSSPLHALRRRMSQTWR